MFDDDKNTFNQFTYVFIDLEVFYHNVSYIKKKYEYKIQVSISHTPEGTNTASSRLTAEGGVAVNLSTISKEHADGVGAIEI